MEGICPLTLNRQKTEQNIKDSTGQQAEQDCDYKRKNEKGHPPVASAFFLEAISGPQSKGGGSK